MSIGNIVEGTEDAWYDDTDLFYQIRREGALWHLACVGVMIGESLFAVKYPVSSTSTATWKKNVGESKFKRTPHELTHRYDQ